MKKDYLERLNGKTNVQQAMILLGKRLNKYSKIGRKSLTKEYLIYNYWLQVDVVVSEQEYNYLTNKLKLA